jgi:hypothetical protein
VARFGIWQPDGDHVVKPAVSQKGVIQRANVVRGDHQKAPRLFPKIRNQFEKFVRHRATGEVISTNLGDEGWSHVFQIRMG